MKNAKFQMYLLWASVGLATMAGSLFWTGFPVLLNQLSNSRISLSEIYLYAISGSFIFSFVAGIWADHSRHRELAVFSQVLSGILVAAIALGTSLGLQTFVLFSLPVLYFNFAFGAVMEAAWLFKSEHGNDLRSRIANRGLLLTSAKLLGFAAGPVCFAAAGESMLLVCTFLFLASGALQFSLILRSRVLKTDSNRTSAEGSSGIRAHFSLLRFHLRDRSFLAMAILTGALSVPLNPVFAGRALQYGNASMASLFWFCGGCASLAGILYAKRMRERIDSLRSSVSATMAMCAAVAVAFFSTNPMLIVGSGALYLFFVPVFSMLLQGRAMKEIGWENTGRQIGMVTAFTEAGIFAGACLSIAAESLAPAIQYGGVTALLVARLWSIRVNSPDSN